MKLINREIDALISKLEEERSIAYRKEQEDFKTDPKVIKLAEKLEKEYKGLSLHLKTLFYNGGVYDIDGTYYYPKDKKYWIAKAIVFLKLKPKPKPSLDKNIRRDIILASADSATIEEVLTKLKLNNHE